MDQASYEFLEKLNNNKTLIDILIACEDALDNLNIYAFKNWSNGVVVDGPSLSRHKCSFILKYPLDSMPDPRGAKRIQKHGMKVQMCKTYEEIPKKDENGQGMLDEDGNPLLEKQDVLFIEVTMPRHYIDDVLERNTEQYAGIVDLDDYEAGATMQDDAVNKQGGTEEGGTEEGGTEEGGGDDLEI